MQNLVKENDLVMSNENITLCLQEMEKGGSFLLLSEDKPGLQELSPKLAGYLVCSASKKNGAEACGKCADCRMYQSGEHPDIFRLETKGRSSTIPVAEIRTLKEKINLRPYQASRKVFIIDEAERLRTEAANAFLKTLEEPPHNAVLILAAPSVNVLLPTVVSRCKVFRGLTLGANKAGGDEATGQLIEEFFAAVSAEKEQGFTEPALKLERPQLENFLENLALVLRDMLVAEISSDQGGYLSAFEKDKLELFSGLFSRESLEPAVFHVLEIKNAVKSNVNTKLALDLLFREIIKCKARPELNG